MAKKFDGIIEAVRYKNGQIIVVRAYERRGATFTDRILIDRKDLLERIQNGKQFLTGARKEFWAGTFEEGKPVKVVSSDGKDFISTRDSSDHDELEETPVF
ncbi:MAG TPA: hypothetical protein VJ972_04190 [Anaerolineales bacterium]|nr:hypothetical protein [Anaerolineales bacterium]